MLKIFILAHIKVLKISAKTNAKNCINTITVHKKENKAVLWIGMHDIRHNLGVKNMSDLIIKAIKEIYETKTPANEQIKRCKIYGKELLDVLAGINVLGYLASSIIIDCKTATAIEFRSKMGFK